MPHRLDDYLFCGVYTARLLYGIAIGLIKYGLTSNDAIWSIREERSYRLNSLVKQNFRTES